MEGSVEVDQHFRSDPDLRKLYYSYLTIGAAVFFLSWAIPVGILILRSGPTIWFLFVLTILFLPFVAIIAFIGLWIPKFHSSLSYLLTESDIVVERGVWWKRKGIVPYNRVTNIDVVQGPLSRLFGLGKVSIQTAGFSSGGGGGSAKAAEAVILGVKNFEDIKDLILARVKRLRPVAVEAEPEIAVPENVDLKILEQLKKIAEILEQQRN